MRLENIKLAGFKSFVDPTTVPFPGNLTAIVGPNGCGKSNIIDAVRWVMGESSAKQLRGESLDDVIFNGSTARKPVGQASIELTFDNSDSTLIGQYASYSQIAIRREITRDGQSNYYLNGTRCRRKDIIDIFLGTGLGPRSYAIIEQGMISRIVEAKPEELRSYIEEAAGISKYKERRRETELRIQHTQENLARLNDLREEITKQLNHLQRQANAAEKYKVLKQEERLLKAQIHILRWRLLNEQLQNQTGVIANYENELVTAMQAQQELELELEQQREAQSQAATINNEVQARYYQLGSEITRLEQAIQHQREKQEQWLQDQQAIAQTLHTLQQQMTESERQQIELQEELAQLAPQHETSQQTTAMSQAALREAEEALQQWQGQWDAFNREAAQANQHVQVEQTRIQHLQQHLQTVENRIARLREEHQQQTLQLSAFPPDELTEQLIDIQMRHTEGEQRLEVLIEQISEQRSQNQTISSQLDAAKSKLQSLHGRQASLEALQKAALGQQDAAIMDWLTRHDLVDKSRLAQLLEVESGWEKAVEAVLDHYLQAICVDELIALREHINELPQGNLAIVAKTTAQSSSLKNMPTLATKVKSSLPVTHLLDGIYIAETLDDALTMTASLASHESIVTREGVCLGNGWLMVNDKSTAQSGVIQRERELNELKLLLEEVTEQVAQAQQNVENGQQQLREYEEQRGTQQQQLAKLVATQAELRAQQQVRDARINQLEQRAQQINMELQDCLQQLENDKTALLNAQQALVEAQQMSEQYNEQRDELLQVKTDYQSMLDVKRQQAQTDRDAEHQLALRLQAARMQLESAAQTQTRLQQQHQELQQRQAQLQQNLSDHAEPLEELQMQLQELLLKRESIQEELEQSRAQVEHLDRHVREMEKQRHVIEQRVSTARSELEQIRLNNQTFSVRAKSIEEQITEQGHTIEQLLEELPAEANEAEWEEQLSQTIRKIERLGAINLAAIDEYKEQEERKTYLDTQYNDLVDALTTLENAMQKMDNETKTRFKETFDLINQQFQSLFPRLFGGGRASLELSENDFLSAGVSMMAQPPGKRNSTIHLLSGGEKALTAIALVFSFFQLNPAPFCMLDEVDAPLDDANVGRFCNLVKEMSEKVQFIFISHNKLAIEMGQHLAGVTMHEAGVSRLVAVDVEQAIAMAEA